MTQRPDQNVSTPSAPRPDTEGLVREHWPAVYRLMYRLTANTHDAEELTQDTFVRAIEKLDRFQPGTSPRAWLLRVATNAFLDTRRRRRPVALEAMEADPPHSGQHVGAAMENGELAAALQRAMLQLSETQRAVFLLRSTEKAPFSEIAEAIGVTEATARWHMLQARQRLLELLDGKL